MVGTYRFVDYGVAQERWHERYVLRVVEGQTCVMLTSDGDVLRETLDSFPFRQDVHGTSAHNLPVPLGKNQGHPAYLFERAVSDAKARSLEGKVELEAKKTGATKFDIGGDAPSKSEAPSSPATPKNRITGTSAPRSKTPPSAKAPVAGAFDRVGPHADPAGESAWLVARDSDLGAEIDLEVGCMVSLGRRCLFYDKALVRAVECVPVAEVADFAKNKKKTKKKKKKKK